MPPGPFDQRDRVELDDATQDPFFRHHYGFPGDPMSEPVDPWRRIDHEWLVGGLSRLATQLDVGVNNTSLALAIELPDGRTLIFPGDAQIGNWLSGAHSRSKGRTMRAERTRYAKDLFNRAAFYKVGHHGSHNATMKAGGLEEMTSGESVAMIPTDQEYASTKRPPEDRGGRCRPTGVHEALRGFTNGRIIRSRPRVGDQLDEEAEQPLATPGAGKSSTIGSDSRANSPPTPRRKRESHSTSSTQYRSDEERP